MCVKREGCDGPVFDMGASVLDAYERGWIEEIVHSLVEEASLRVGFGDQWLNTVGKLVSTAKSS